MAAKWQLRRSPPQLGDEKLLASRQGEVRYMRDSTLCKSCLLLERANMRLLLVFLRSRRPVELVVSWLLGRSARPNSRNKAWRVRSLSEIANGHSGWSCNSRVPWCVEKAVEEDEEEEDPQQALWVELLFKLENLSCLRLALNDAWGPAMVCRATSKWVRMEECVDVNSCVGRSSDFLWEHPQLDSLETVWFEGLTRLLVWSPLEKEHSSSWTSRTGKSTYDYLNFFS